MLQSKAIAVENDLRGTLRNFGLKVGMVGKVKFEARIRLEPAKLRARHLASFQDDKSVVHALARYGIVPTARLAH